jgi:hypothetical protein
MIHRIQHLRLRAVVKGIPFITSYARATQDLHGGYGPLDAGNFVR